MDQRERVEQGERVFLLGFLTAFVAEAGLSIVNAGLLFGWKSVLWGLFGFGLMFYLGARLYEGNRTALRIAQAWITLNVLLAGAVIWLALAFAQSTAIIHQLGIAEPWLAAIRGVVYLGLGQVLFATGSVRDYLASRRGEAVALEPAEAAPGEFFVATTTDKGPAAVLDAKSQVLFTDMGRTLKVVGGVLVLLSLAELVGAVYYKFFAEGGDWFGLLVIGVITHLLGMILTTGGADVNYLATTRGYEQAHLSNAILSLRTFYRFLLGGGIIFLIIILLKWIR